jgi:HAMP domain-containing protein
MRRSTVSPGRLAVASVVLGGVLLAAAVMLPRVVPVWFLVPAGALLGAAAASVGLWQWFVARWTEQARRLATACRQVECGDLSRTVPEDGPAPLAEVARAVNTLTADFQEVLLLFAHLVRSARLTVRSLQRHLRSEPAHELDRLRAAQIMSDIEQMEEMISDFKYFRVRIEDDAIVDTGVSGRAGHVPDPVPETGATEARPEDIRKGDGR